MQHLEFCIEISDSEVSLIVSRHFKHSYGPMERFSFFPALISVERPSEASAVRLVHSAYTVTMQCVQEREMKCITLDIVYSQILKCILDAKAEVCPTVKVKEFLIDLTLREVQDAHMFSITELADALVAKKAIIVSELGQKTVAIDHLLYFEPYAYVSPQILFSEEYSNKVISKAFMDEVSTSYTKVGKFSASTVPSYELLLEEFHLRPSKTSLSIRVSSYFSCGWTAPITQRMEL